VKKKKKTSKTVPKRQPARQSRARTKPEPQPRARKAQPPKKTPTRRRASAPTPVEAAVVEAAPERVLAPRSPVDVPVDEVIVLETPEPRFASRVLPPEADRPFPAPRRAIFFDVENASRPEHIARVIEHLEVDRTGRRTDFVAVGNWRVIGHDSARLLARHGAHLIHSAPSVGVRDWSDLRIAVGAGVWLASARAGDVLEIITSDRAFDAVGDVAASLGIEFRRLSHQGITGAAEACAPVREAPTASRSASYRGRSRRRGPWRDRAAPSAPAPAASAAVISAPVEPSPPREFEPVVIAPPPPPLAAGHPAEHTAQTAPRDELIALVHDLMQRSPGRPLTLDTLANALKSRGFSRPPGSPRLITRLRRIKEIALSRTGVVTLVGSQDAVSAEEFGAVQPDVDARDVDAEDIEPGNVLVKKVEAEDVEAQDLDTLDGDEGPGPGNEAVPGQTAAAPVLQDARRRRSRRGGRGGRRPRPEAARAG
jgi:hypothetical protein